MGAKKNPSKAETMLFPALLGAAIPAFAVIVHLIALAISK
jgi:hypothetical protein